LKQSKRRNESSRKKEKRTGEDKNEALNSTLKAKKIKN